MKTYGNNTRFIKNNHKSFLLKIAVCLFLVSGFTVRYSKAQNTGGRYNVIFISLDDMADKTNYLGYPQVLTPNLQRLISKSTAFTNAYCQFPLCNPSRSSIMTGWRPDKTKVLGNGQDPLQFVPAGANYLQDYFHSFGYRTERYGKIYHGAYEYQFNWDYSEGGGNAAFQHNGDESAIAAPANSGGEVGGAWGIDPTNDTTNGDYTLVVNLINSIKQPSSQPRFFALGLTTHNPFTPTIDFWNIYGDPNTKVNIPVYGGTSTIKGNSSANIAIPSTPANDRADVPSIAFFAGHTVPKSDSEWQKTVQAYYGEVSRMDKHLGMLLDEMDRDNLWSNTVIIFVSDHGQQLGEHEGLWLKNTLFYESLHVPLAVYAPGKTAAICDKLVEEVDVYPTLTELCKLPTPKNLEGTSLVRLMDNPTQTWKTAAFAQLKTPPSYLVLKAGAVITNQYHYNNWESKGEELYDRINDPKEYTNLAGNPNYTSALEYMRSVYTGGWQNALPPPCDSVVYYQDNDGDGFGNTDSIFKGCYQPLGYSINGGDCDDSNPAIYPDSSGICTAGDPCIGFIASIAPSGSVKLCSGSSLVLTANTGTGITYQWYKNGVLIAGATTAQLSITKSGNYTVSETNTFNCSDTSAVTAVSTVKNPAANITALGSLDICATGSVTLQANTSAGLSYQWKKGNTNIPGATNAQLTVSNIGTYYVVVTNSNNCSKQSKGTKVTKSCFAPIANATQSLNLAQMNAAKLSLFPNPTTGKVVTRFYSEYNGKIKLTVYDITGKQVYTSTELAVKGNNNIMLQLGHLVSGMYYLELLNNKATQRIKFTVER